MKDHKLAIIDAAGELFDQGYHVYPEFKVYRFPFDPDRCFEHFRVDVLATKEADTVIVEVGYCTSDKLKEIKELMPFARVIHYTQWKNFVPVKVSPTKKLLLRREKRTNRRILKWSEEEIKLLIEVCHSSSCIESILSKFPERTKTSVTGTIDRLYRQGFLDYKPCFYEWTAQEDHQLIVLRKFGLDINQLIEVFSNHKKCNIINRIKYLRPSHPEMYTHRRGKKKKIQDNPQPVNQKIKIIHEKEIKIVRELKVVTKTKIEKPVRKKKQKVTYTTIWTPEDDALLIRLRSGGAYMRVLKEALPCHRQCDIDKRIQFLKSQNLLGSFSYGQKSINPPLIV